MKKVPLWIIASLGREVVLTADFVGPCETYLAGCDGVLMGVVVDDQTGAMHCLVALDPNDPTYLENFAFDRIRPPTKTISFTLDIEEGFMEF